MFHMCMHAFIHIYMYKQGCKRYTVHAVWDRLDCGGLPHPSLLPQHTQEDRRYKEGFSALLSHRFHDAAECFADCLRSSTLHPRPRGEGGILELLMDMFFFGIKVG